MTEPAEDRAAELEASIQAKRFERGQTIERRIGAIGAEVAFVDVGGSDEALLDLDEPKGRGSSADTLRGALGTRRK